MPAVPAGDAELQWIAQSYTKHVTNTILAFKNALDWMVGDADLAEVSAKLLRSAEGGQGPLQ